jgi:hypothetical protein
MKKALLVGVNEYAPQKPLRGCLNDVAAMAKILNDVFDYDSVVILTNSQVTKSSLKLAIESLLEPEENEVDGARVFFFAGHGGRVIDIKGDEVDKVDENICLPNYIWSDDSTYIIDDELAKILGPVNRTSPWMRVYIILDSCHSGTATREVTDTLTWKDIDEFSKKWLNIDNPKDARYSIDDPRLPLLSVSRQASDAPEVDIFLRSRRSSISVNPIGMAPLNTESMFHLLLSGCAAAQTSKESPIDGAYHGVFSYNLVKIASQNPNSTWGQLQSAIKNSISAEFNQDPQLEGRPFLAALTIFS